MGGVFQIFFWAAFALLAYAYLLYPTILFAVAHLVRTDGGDTQSDTSRWLPSVTVIISAFNEEIHIGPRIANLLALDYPREKLAIFIGSDGSTDQTVDIIRKISDDRVTLLAFETNRGKASVLNDCVARAASDVLVFSDANTVFKPDAVRHLVAGMNAQTAATCGELILQAPSHGKNVDHAYWSFESRLKEAESKIGGLVGANGGIYAIRKAHFQPISADTICDDFVISMRIASSGNGLRFVPEAVAFEDTPVDVVDEFHRRTRIGIGNYQALFRYPEFLFGGPYALRFTYFSHKILRWVTPHLLLAILVCSAALVAESFFQWILLLQLAGYTLCVAVFYSRGSIPWPKAMMAGMYFMLLHFAFMIGFKRFLLADYRGSWRRTERSL